MSGIAENVQPADSLRIAMVAACPFPYPRGTPVRIHRLSNALAERGHEVHVFTYHLGEATENERIIIHRVARVPTYRKRSPGPSFQKLFVVDALLSAKLSAWLRKESFDVIHAHHYEGLIAAKLARLRRRIPLVYDAHTLLGSELPFFRLGLPKGLVSRLGNRLDRRLPRLADHVVSVTQAIKDKLIGFGMDADDVTVITNGVEREFLDAVKNATGRRAGSRTVVFAGNLASYQGVDNLLEAFAKVGSQREDVRLLFITDSSFEPYEAMARELGIRERIDFTNAPVPEHPALLARAAVAVNPRIDADGIPQKLLNYMAAGCPTVSFEGSAPCIEHGKTGWVVARGDVGAFAGGLLKLLDEAELAQRLGNNAREAVLASYTWDIAAEKSEALYLRLLGVPESSQAAGARGSS